MQDFLDYFLSVGSTFTELKNLNTSSTTDSLYIYIQVIPGSVRVIIYCKIVVYYIVLLYLDSLKLMAKTVGYNTFFSDAKPCNDMYIFESHSHNNKVSNLLYLIFYNI